MENKRNEYRKHLAETLKSTESREERKNILRDEKLTSEYVHAAATHYLEREHGQSEKELERIIAESSDFDTLTVKLAESSLMIKNEAMGLDHGEHLIKRIEMARRFGDLNLIPEAGGLRDAITRFFSSGKCAVRKRTDTY